MMTVGMLWQVPKGRKVQDSLIDAIREYRKKYGQDATVAILNPLDADEGFSAPVVVKTARYVQPGTIWLGRES